MTIKVEWENTQKTIIRYTFEGTFNSDEIYSALQTGYALQDEVAPNDIWIIVDSLNNIKMPGQIYTIANYLKRHRRANMRGTVILTTNMMIRSITELIIYMLNQQSIVFFATSHEEAITIIHSQQTITNKH